MAMTALQWKRFYQHEREAIGTAAIERLIADAPDLDLGWPNLEAAVIFPHTRLRVTGSMTASVARAIIESEVHRVLAIGVLHGGREEDSHDVARARAGDETAVKALRGIHGPGAPDDRGIWTEEFSLDNFKHFVNRTAELYGRRPPAIIERYPFLTGTDPNSLSGMDELSELRKEGVPVVATADLIHHGIGYDTPKEFALDESDPNTLHSAKTWIEEGTAALISKDYAAFQANAGRVKSDFRHSGPVLSELLSEVTRTKLLELRLVNYSDVLRTARPTWVAGALILSV